MFTSQRKKIQGYTPERYPMLHSKGLFLESENKRRRAMLMEFKMKQYRTMQRDSILIVLAVVIIGVLFTIGEFHSLYSAIQW